jgi:hypothetical protein
MLCVDVAPGQCLITRPGDTVMLQLSLAVAGGHSLGIYTVILQIRTARFARLLC